MGALYSVAEIVAATGGFASGVESQHVTSVSIDSREIAPGALFVAIKGDQFDGHDFVEAAIAKGAVAALVSKKHASRYAGLALITVPDSLEGLVDLARAARARSNAKIVAITGSVGKTSTKEAIRHVLSGAGKTHASIKSFNNLWGVSLMLARMPRDMDFGVFELGMNHAGEISLLSKLVQPHIAVITSIAPAHLDQLGSLEAIAHAKSEIFDGLVKQGCAVINIDHDYANILLTKARALQLEKIVTYGFCESAEVRIEPVAQHLESAKANIVWPDLDLELTLASAGRHRLANATAALCVARLLRVDVEKALAVLATLKEMEGRGAILSFGPASNPLQVVDESYNANPLSMQASLEVFAGMSTPSGCKVLVLGDMLELGPTSEELHANLATAILNCSPDRIYLVGKHMAVLSEKLGKTRISGHGLTIGDISASILNGLDYGDLVMVKGSNGVRLGDLVSQMRERFTVVGATEQADEDIN